MLAGAPLGTEYLGEVLGDVSPVTPTVQPEIEGISLAFDADPLAAEPEWTRIDTGASTGIRISRWELRRGRSFEIDKTDTGTGTIYGTDTLGYLDPTNPINVDGIVPGGPIALALQNPVTAVWTTLIRGHVSEFRYDVEPSENVVHWEIDLVGPFDMIAATAMIPGRHGDTPPAASLGDVYFNEDTGLDACQTRINKILDDVGWPAGLREIFTGNVGLQGTVYARLDSALSAMYDTADAEFPGVANVYERKDGAVVFHGRFARFDPANPDYNIHFWAAGDDTACAADSTRARINVPFTFAKGKSHLINACLSLPKGVDQTDVPGNMVEDAPSQAMHGVRSESFTDLLTLGGDGAFGPTTAVEETKKFADYYVQNYKDARTRVDTITFKSQHPDSPYGPAQWALICGVEIGDMLTITTTHPNGGFVEAEFFVDGVTYTCDPARPEYPDITLECALTPAGYYSANPFL